jgi:uncharacterized membrane protein YphA (DoxX/SURF4 family)
MNSLLAALAPIVEALLRVAVGLALVPHGLRNTFGFFPDTGIRAKNLTQLAAQLDGDGYRPGKVWAPAISIVQLLGGPMLAAGLFTRAVAAPIVIFLIVACWEQLARRRIFLERARARIHPDVDDRGAVFSGARRRGVFVGSCVVRPLIPSS